MSKKISVFYVIMAGILWGSMGLFVRGLSKDNLTSLEIVTLRSVGALLFMFFYILIKDRSQLRIRLKDIWCFVGTGIVSLTFFNYCYFTTIQKTSMAVAAILLYTSPVFVVIFSYIIFKEVITKVKICAMLLALVGCALVTGILSGETGNLNMSGIIIGLGAGVGYAFYSIFGRFALNKGYSSVTITFYTFLLSTLGSLFLTNPAHAVNKVCKGNTVYDLLLIIGISLFVTVLPYLFYTKGLSNIENGTAGIMAAIEPVVAGVLGVVVFHESLGVTTIVGIVMVLASIVMLSRG